MLRLRAGQKEAFQGALDGPEADRKDWDTAEYIRDHRIYLLKGTISSLSEKTDLYFE